MGLSPNAPVFRSKLNKSIAPGLLRAKTRVPARLTGIRRWMCRSRTFLAAPCKAALLVATFRLGVVTSALAERYRRKVS
jgi:hypothetical protein